MPTEEEIAAQKAAADAAAKDAAAKEAADKAREANPNANGADGAGGDDGADDEDSAGLKALKEKVSKANREAEGLRKRLHAIEAEKKAKEDAALAEQGKWKELFEKNAKETEELRKVKDELQSSFKETLEAELASIPEEHRDLIPDALSDKQKLEMVRKLRAKGLLEKPSANGTPAPKPKTTPNAPRTNPTDAGNAPTISHEEIQEMEMPWTKPERKRELQTKLTAYQEHLRKQEQKSA
jgi:hypothetical protein